MLKFKSVNAGEVITKTMTHDGFCNAEAPTDGIVVTNDQNKNTYIPWWILDTLRHLPDNAPIEESYDEWVDPKQSVVSDDTD